MDTLKSLHVFRQVVELGSFVKASENLNISTAMASKHVKHLEETVQVKLLNRSSRSLSLTEAGTIYYQQAIEALDTLANAGSMVQQGSSLARGRLKISAPVWFSHHTFIEKLAQFQERFPHIQLSFNLNDHYTDLVAGGYDLALRVTNNPPEHLIARQLTNIPFYWVASPSYLNKYGVPTSINDLAEHHGISANFLNNNPAHQSYNDSNNTQAIHEMALQGMGVTLTPGWLADEEIKSGRLVHILSEEDLSSNLYAIYPDRKFLSNKIRVFIDFMVESFQTN